MFRVLNRDSFRKHESGRLVWCCKRSSSLGVQSEAFISRDYSLHEKKSECQLGTAGFQRKSDFSSLKKKTGRFRGQVNKYDKHSARTWEVACLKEIYKSLRRRMNTRSLQRPPRFKTRFPQLSVYCPCGEGELWGVEKWETGMAGVWWTTHCEIFTYKAVSFHANESPAPCW